MAPRSHKGLFVALAVSVLGAACVEQDPPGVGVQKLAADIVFGVEPASEAPPPNQIPSSPGVADPVTYVPAAPTRKPAPAFTPPTFPVRTPRPPSTRLPRPTPLSPAKTSCPPAALNAFPAQEAGINISALPQEGQYRWKRTGKQTTAALPGVEIPISGFEQRLVRNVEKISDTEFTFETAQPELGSKVTTLSRFKVKTTSVNREVEPPVERVPVDPPNAVPVTIPPLESRRLGDPERGIVLQSIERVDEAGNSQTVTFRPGVLYLPLDVIPGEKFESVGIDSRTGQVLQHSAKVLTRKRIDACGDIVDGWEVEATQTFSGASTSTRNYRYIVAPQLGGIIISENLQATSPQTSIDITLSLAQLKPSALPKDEQK